MIARHLTEHWFYLGCTFGIVVGVYALIQLCREW